MPKCFPRTRLPARLFPICWNPSYSPPGVADNGLKVLFHVGIDPLLGSGVAQFFGLFPRAFGQYLYLAAGLDRFTNALIYARIWPLSIHGLGKLTKTGSSLLIMGLSGNAILPLVYGAVADVHGLRAGYWVLVPCFLYIMWFAFYGHKIRSWKRTEGV